MDVGGVRVPSLEPLTAMGRPASGKWRAEPRPEPDSGNPTVRDRRGASGNVASWSVLHAARAPDFYLDTRTLGSARGAARADKAKGCPYRDPISDLTRVDRCPLSEVSTSVRANRGSA